MKISLRLAPEVFFDREKWDQFVRQFESADLALARISVPPPIPGDGFHRAGDAGLPAQPQARNEHFERTFQLGVALVAQFKTDLVEGLIIASGIPEPYGERRIIPAEECGRVWPNFREQTFEGPLFGYAQVTLKANNTPRAVNSRLLRSCCNWLSEQKLSGDVRKKEDLRALAKYHFGQALPTRVFNQAYARIYDRARGRPRKKT